MTLPFWMRPLKGKPLAYARLMRLDRPIGTWLLLLPALWGIALADPSRLDLMGLFVIGALVMRSAGCIINDLWDQKLDSSVERTQARPLAAGIITRTEAYGLLFVLLCIGLFILLQLTPMAVLVGLFSMLLVIAYPLMKRVTWWPQLFLGFTFNIGVLMGWAAALRDIGTPAWWLYAAGIFWTLGYDTIYAHQDKDDDAMAGIKSTARLFKDKSKYWVAGFYAVAVALLFMAVKSPLALLVLPHFAWQVWKWDMDDPASSLRFFKSNRDAGLIVLLTVFLTSV